MCGESEAGYGRTKSSPHSSSIFCALYEWWLLLTLACLLPLSTTYQELLQSPCGEAVFRHVLLAQAALLPLYGALDLTSEQLRNVFSVCQLALPEIPVQEAKKRSAEIVFSYKNLAAIEALSVVCGGNGEGMKGVWELVEATLEIVEEYVPGKDNENNYVRQGVGSDG